MRGRLAVMLAALVSLSLAVACAQTESGITAKVKTKLAADTTVSAAKIEVTTRNKVVTLTGNVDSQEAKNRALALARETEGVVEVVDMISVQTADGGDAPEPDRTVGERLDDAGITMSVKSKLLDDPVVRGLKIDVDTRDGVVYLTGSVRSEAEKSTAVRLAQETKGVRDVQANLTIESS